MSLYKRIERKIFPCQKHIDVLMDGYHDALKDLNKTMAETRMNCHLLHLVNQAIARGK